MTRPHPRLRGRRQGREDVEVEGQRRLADRPDEDPRRRHPPLWTVSADYAEDIRIGKEILDGIGDNYRRLRNTLRYILGNLDGFTRPSGCRTARCRSSSAGCCTA
jgi:hypothetical protein